jgi:hypothetical protein
MARGTAAVYDRRHAMASGKRALLKGGMPNVVLKNIVSRKMP